MKIPSDQVSRKKPRRLLVFGDSHAVHCFDRFTDARIFHQGPVTMHRVGRDGADFVSRSVPISDPNDLFVFVFGEIDVRCHIGKISDSQALSRTHLVNNLVMRFADEVHDAMTGHDGDVVLCSVVPTSTFTGDPQFPTYGTVSDRISITKLVNRALKAAAAEHDFLFLDFAKLYADRSGALKVSKSDGSVHIGINHTRQIRDELSCTLNEPVRYRWDLWWRSWPLWPAEWLLSKIHPPTMRYFNRRHVNVQKSPK